MWLGRPLVLAAFLATMGVVIGVWLAGEDVSTPPAGVSGQDKPPPSPVAHNARGVSESSENPGREAIARGAFDEWALPGQAFVAKGGAGLFASATPRGRPRLRLSAGQRVDRVRVVENMVLVLVPPKGPVGYVRRKLLTEAFPLSVLGDRLGFAPCEVTPPDTLEDCQRGAKGQFDACREECGDYPKTRCPAACAAAFEGCLQRCKEPLSPGDDDRKSNRRRTARRSP